MNSSAAQKPPGCVWEVFQPQFGRRNPGFVFRSKLAPKSFPVYTHANCTCKLKFFTLFVWQRGCTSHLILQVTSFMGFSFVIKNQPPNWFAKRAVAIIFCG
jgi:hypothetical protein